MDHPYRNLPKRAFWQTSIAELSPFEVFEIYKPRFPIDSETRITVAGSCFAQYIGRQFKRRGYKFLDVEQAPPMLPTNRFQELGYDIYSARYGNIYTARQLIQLFQRANGTFRPKEPIWMKEGRYYDPFRPNIQKNGFVTEEEAIRDRDFHLDATESLLKNTDLFVFTFGLTESWLCTSDEAVLPTCPGILAGTYDSEKYVFHNFSFSEVLDDTEAFIKLARNYNADMRFLFTVSPVPLTATASGDHVLTATLYSKSVLRVVCGTLTERYDFVDYFPSYELIATHPTRGVFFKPNLREVSNFGVEYVMKTFFSAQNINTVLNENTKINNDVKNEDDIVCEEAILEGF